MLETHICNSKRSASCGATRVPSTALLGSALRPLPQSSALLVLLGCREARSSQQPRAGSWGTLSRSRKSATSQEKKGFESRATHFLPSAPKGLGGKGDGTAPRTRSPSFGRGKPALVSHSRRAVSRSRSPRNGAGGELPRAAGWAPCGALPQPPLQPQEPGPVT